MTLVGELYPDWVTVIKHENPLNGTWDLSYNGSCDLFVLLDLGWEGNRQKMIFCAAHLYTPAAVCSMPFLYHTPFWWGQEATQTMWKKCWAGLTSLVHLAVHSYSHELNYFRGGCLLIHIALFLFIPSTDLVRCSLLFLAYLSSHSWPFISLWPEKTMLETFSWSLWVTYILPSLIV